MATAPRRRGAGGRPAAGPARGRRGGPRRGPAHARPGAGAGRGQRGRAPGPLGGGRRAARPGPAGAGHLLAQGLHPADQPLPRRLLLLHLRPRRGRPARPHDEPRRGAGGGRGRPGARLQGGPLHPRRPPRGALREPPAGAAALRPRDHPLLPGGDVPAGAGGDRPAAPPQRRHPRPARAGRAARGLGQPGDDAGVGLRAALRARRPPRGRPRQAPQDPPGDDPPRRPARHPLHLGHPDRHRRDSGRARRGPAGPARPARGGRPHPGGDRPELPRQARHADGGRGRAGAGRADDRLRDRAPGDGPGDERPGAAQPVGRLRPAAAGRHQRLGRGLPPHPRLRQPRGPLARARPPRAALRRRRLRPARAAHDLPRVPGRRPLPRPGHARARARPWPGPTASPATRRPGRPRRWRRERHLLPGRRARAGRPGHRPRGRRASTRRPSPRPWPRACCRSRARRAAGPALAWVVDPAGAMALQRAGVAGWRITVRHEGPRADVLDALARSGAAFLRTDPARLEEAIELGWLPAIATRVSVPVASLEEALDAIAAGAVNLVVGDWGPDEVGALREALAPRPLVERTALPPETEIDDARADLPRPLFTAWLARVDGSGAARPRYSWAPGRDEAAPGAAAAPVGRVGGRRLGRRRARAGPGPARARPGRDPRALAGGPPAAGRRDRAPLPRPRARGRGGGRRRRRAAPRALRRGGHLRRQPQHQLHQPVLLPLRLLRLLARAQEPQPARRPLHPRASTRSSTARSRPGSAGRPRSACRAASTPTSPATSTSACSRRSRRACPRCTCTASRRWRSGRAPTRSG